MKLTSRTSSSGFIEIKTDEIETTIFKNSSKEIDDTIQNLLDIVEELAKLKDITISVAFHEVE